jgi:hypothetical protein
MVDRKIFNLGVEAITPQNDGWSKKGARDKLEKKLETLSESEVEEITFIHRLLALCESPFMPS